MTDVQWFLRFSGCSNTKIDIAIGDVSILGLSNGVQASLASAGGTLIADVQSTNKEEFTIETEFPFIGY